MSNNTIRNIFLTAIFVFTSLSAACGTVTDANGKEYPAACAGMTRASMSECAGFATQQNPDLGQIANAIADSAQPTQTSK